MTPNQLRTVLARLGLSQRAAARLLGIDERTMRNYVAGDLVIPELLVWALRGLAHCEQDRDAPRNRGRSLQCGIFDPAYIGFGSYA
jgi:hypothetical protein